MERLDQTVRGGGQDRAGLQGLSFRVLPVVPDAGKAHDGAVLHPDVERLLLSAFLLPLEKASCGDNAAAIADRGPEGRFLVNRFAAGIYHPAADGGILGPGRNQPPAHEGCPVAGFRSPDCQYLLGGSDVVARGEITEDCDAEDFGEEFGDIASAHNGTE